MNELTQFASQVLQMRLAQQTYFRLAKKPRATRTPTDFAAIKNALEDSKKVEQEVDTRIAQIFKLSQSIA